MCNKTNASEYKKMSPEDVEGLMHMRRRAFALKNKKGKGSYNRAKERKNFDDYEQEKE